MSYYFNILLGLLLTWSALTGYKNLNYNSAEIPYFDVSSYQAVFFDSDYEKLDKHDSSHTTEKTKYAMKLNTIK